MEVTKVIEIDQNSLGFEVGENPKWRGEFTLEQVAHFGIKAGKDLTVHLLEMQDVFANVEFNENEKTTVPVSRVSENTEMFSSEPPEEADDAEMLDTLYNKQ
jgi:hypothetical protein